MKSSALQILAFLLINGLIICQAFRRYTFVVKNSPYIRLCSRKNILTVNGQFPGPTLYVTKGETIIVDVYNRANYNITIHWHGVEQPRCPWSDGPEYITQCPIRLGQKFSKKVMFSKEEGEWWKSDIAEVYNRFLKNGKDPQTSNAYTINGQPGDLYPCSKSDTFKLMVEYGKTYLLRMINAAIDENLFFAIVKHNLTVVGIDGSYIKPMKVNYITIYPGQTMDVLLETNHALDHYYMAAKAYSDAPSGLFDNTTSIAILSYKGNYTPTSTTPSLPFLPSPNDINASINLISQLRSLENVKHPIDVPLEISTKLFFTMSINSLLCLTCENARHHSSSMNNISFELPTSNNILQAYYNNISGVYRENLPNVPPLFFDFTTDILPTFLETLSVDTKVKVLDFNSTVEIILQGTNLRARTKHPMHLHGHSFYVVGWGFGNFDKDKDPLTYNLVDPPFQNTIAISKND